MDEYSAEPPQLLADMRLIAGGVDVDTPFGRKLGEQFDKDFERFLERLQKLELAYQKQLTARSERLAAEAVAQSGGVDVGPDRGSMRVQATIEDLLVECEKAI